MEIQTSLDGRIATIRLTGRLTVSDKPGELKQAATSAVANGARSVVLDLARVPYIDSTRLGELIAVHVTVSRAGGRLALAGATDRITELLTVAGLEGIFESFGSVDQAHTALGS
jgi:anti-anti-sigma factor